jgi:hypothetical protein
MKLSDLLIIISFILVVLGFGLYLYFSFVSRLFFEKKEKTTPERASTFGEFINGLTGPIFALAGFIIIYATIMDQNEINNLQHFESHFFKQMDYNRENNIKIAIKSPKSCKEIQGGKVWVSFYSQIKKAYHIIEKDSLLESQSKRNKVDLAFSTFYFGISNIDSVRLYSVMDKLNLTEESKLNYVSQLKSIEHCSNWKSYFTGFTNKFGSFLKQYFAFITFVDNQDILTAKQKADYINMLNLQNDIFCQITIYYYLESSLCTDEEIVLKEKYKLFPSIDTSLLFHLKTFTTE